jgi:hypothetical protein
LEIEAPLEKQTHPNHPTRRVLLPTPLSPDLFTMLEAKLDQAALLKRLLDG